ncbi:unnamed protein product [Urochloa decumbens]
MSQEEFEWRRRQYKMAGQRMPHLLDDLRTHSERMRHHFRDDPDALAKWVRYENEVHAAFESNLKNPIALRMRLPNSVLYKILMKESSSKSLVGMFSGRSNKRIGGAAAVGVAIGIAVLPGLVEPVEAAED